MESLLTPVVGRLLSKFVKSAAGTDGSDLRASLQGGNVSLHNLELNLDTMLHKLPVAVERAFAMQLTVSIPWTSLTSQPIQVFQSFLTYSIRAHDIVRHHMHVIKSSKHACRRCCRLRWILLRWSCQGLLIRMKQMVRGKL